MAQVGHSPLYPGVAPIEIPDGHPHDEVRNYLRGSRPSRALSPRAIVPLFGDQFAMPCQNCIRRDDAGYLTEGPTAQPLTLDRQSPSLLVCETKPLSPELFLQHPVLFWEILNDCLLMLVNSAGKCEQEKMQW